MESPQPQSTSVEQQSYTTNTDFTKLVFNFEIKLALDDIATQFHNYYHPSNKLKLYLFLRDKINGESREYFLSKLFKTEQDKEEFFSIMLETERNNHEK